MNLSEFARTQSGELTYKRRDAPLCGLHRFLQLVRIHVDCGPIAPPDLRR
jgi:hypothetical protein